MEKIPAESGPWTIGVSKTRQVWPRSGEWKTRAALPPVANQMLGSGSGSILITAGSIVMTGTDSRGAADVSAALVALGRPGSLAALGMTGFGRIAKQVLLAAK